MRGVGGRNHLFEPKVSDLASLRKHSFSIIVSLQDHLKMHAALLLLPRVLPTPDA